ncbi:hypothetical protein C8R47DRAFT_746649 [Mycena vitilis]|nr:hypothetical protein C8R47DRAFT_746649 [Mycena vitilis]
MDPALATVIHGNSPPTDLQLRDIQSMLAASQAELVQLDATILAVSLILSELKSQKSDRRKDVDALLGALSPIRRLPPEILSAIFLLCRDNSLQSDYHFTADPREAPIVLGQVSSGWRSICHGTPLLWDNIRLVSVLAMPKLPYIQKLLDRSHNLPVSARLASPYKDMLRNCPMELPPEPAVALLMGLHGRLRTITLEIPTLNLLPPYNLHQREVFPILTSLDIILADPEGQPDVASALNAFSNAPCLEHVSLISHCIPRHSQSLVDTLPWAQLTELLLYMPISLRDVRTILALARRLQKARISDITWSDDSVERTVELPDLETFHFHFENDDFVAPIEFFGAFSFPSLRDLDLRADLWAPNILHSLLDRSQFKLERLALSDFLISTEELLQVLRRLPTLQELTLAACGTDVELPKMFTIDPGSASHRLTLPQLRRLCLSEFADVFEGTSAADMAESLCLHRGQPTSAFPALQSVLLSLHGNKFDSDVERRLAIACSTGLIFDEQVGVRT